MSSLAGQIGMKQIVLDIGNTRVKISDGVCCAAAAHRQEDFLDRFAECAAKFTEAAGCCSWWIASVNRPVLAQVRKWLAEERAGEPVTVLTYRNIPIRMNVDFPERVGVDRLLAAAAANELRDPDRPAIVADLGTALKVDLVAQDGVFCGGAIAPGLRMSAVAMEEQTDALPCADVDAMLGSMKANEISSLGRNTLDAIQAGLFWGTVGTIRELTAQTSAHLHTKPQVFLTGGGAGIVRDALGDGFLYVEEMVLKGLWAAVRELSGE